MIRGVTEVKWRWLPLQLQICTKYRQHPNIPCYSVEWDTI